MSLFMPVRQCSAFECADVHSSSKTAPLPCRPGPKFSQPSLAADSLRANLKTCRRQLPTPPLWPLPERFPTLTGAFGSRCKISPPALVQSPNFVPWGPDRCSFADRRCRATHGGCKMRDADRFLCKPAAASKRPTGSGRSVQGHPQFPCLLCQCFRHHRRTHDHH